MYVSWQLFLELYGIAITVNALWLVVEKIGLENKIKELEKK
jgi:hypothetical protein